MSQGPPPSLDMDAVAAHLDRGWELLQKNDLRGAEISARRALELDAQEAEALTLLGAIAAAGGDDEEALAQYRQAIDADPEYATPLLYAAETLLHLDQDLEDALAYLEDALDLAHEEDELLDAVLLKAEIHLALEDEEAARETMGSLEQAAFSDAGFHLRAAHVYLELGDLDQAAAHYRGAIEKEADLADAHYGLGMVHERRGELREMVNAWLQTRALDEKEPPVPWAMTPDQFEAVAEAALAELPARIRKLLENVPILVSDRPAREIVAEGNDPRMLGFFSGVPYPEKSHVMGGAGQLDCVFLYQRNIEKACRSAEEVEREIRITLLHETGHFFGLSEEDLHGMGLG